MFVDGSTCRENRVLATSFSWSAIVRTRITQAMATTGTR